MDNQPYEIRAADESHGDAILALMPRLADYDVPANRNPQHLWMHDAEMFRQWLDGEVDCLVHVALDSSGKVLGFSMVRLRPELLSHEPSAHLEAIAVDPQAEGKGVAKALLGAAEASAKAMGALTMTLHVFAANTRARGLYEKTGYDGELMRYIKHLDDPGPA
jgi:ribosomal protein S18 acetylase RimI-like enzyme